MPDGSSENERTAALRALGEASGFDVTMLDELFPVCPWREVVPAEILNRREVLEQQDYRARFDLHVGLEELLGPEHAATLMEYLPPVPWSALRPYGLVPPTRDTS